VNITKNKPIQKRWNRGTFFQKKFLRTSIVGIITFLVFLFLPFVTEIFSVELRVISAVLSEFILKVLMFPVERAGTVLSINDMVIDIIPACNGSTTIRVLFAFNILIIGLSLTLNYARKAILMILALFIAIIANGIRVSLLIIASCACGHIIPEGPLHNTIGVFGYLFALLMNMFLIDLLSTPEAKSEASLPGSRREPLFFTLVMTAFIFAPFFSACVRDWFGTGYNENDMFGYIFLIAWLVPFVTLWFRYQRNEEHKLIAEILLSLILIGTAVLQMVEANNYILGGSFLLFAMIISLSERGLKFAIVCSPLALVLFMSFSKVSEFIWIFVGIQSLFVTIIIKSIIAISAIFVCFVLAKKFPSGETEAVYSKINYSLISLCAAIIALIISVKGYNLEINNIKYDYTMNYMIDGWNGYDVIDGNTSRFHGKTSYINRLYKKNGKYIGVLVIPSDGYRANIHTPEYCQFAIGWNVLNKESATIKNNTGSAINATVLKLTEAKNTKRNFVYWFDDGESTTSSYFTFMAKNILRQCYGRKDNWILYIVWNDGDYSLLRDFIEEFNGVDVLQKSRLQNCSF